MASDMVVKNKELSMPVPPEAITPPSDPDPKSDHHHFTRKVQARGHLSSHLRDRAVGGPLKWSRSLTDVGLQTCKSQDALGGSAAPLGNVLPRSPTRGQHRHLAYSYHHHQQQQHQQAGECSQQSSARTRSRLLSSRHSKATEGSPGGGEWSQKMTLSELRKFLQTRDGGTVPARDNGGIPKLHKGMSINIQRAVESYPNIALTVKEDMLNKTAATAGKNKTHANLAKSRPQEVQPVILPILSLEPANNTITKLGSKPDTKVQLAPFLTSSHMGRANPEEWTKRWIQENPLGPEVNEEYAMETPTPRKTVKSEESDQEPSPKSPRSPRKVRFGTDKFLF